MTQKPLNSTWMFTPENPTQINSVAISDDGSRCVFGSSFERGEGQFYTYLFDGEGQKRQKKAIAEGISYQGVFWVDVSGDGRFYATGGETQNPEPSKKSHLPKPTQPGFLQAYAAGSGDCLLNVTRSDRINQVSLSQDGQYLAVCYGHTVEVFRLSGTTYQSIFKHQTPDFSINSCEISGNGKTVVTSGIHYADDNQQTLFQSRLEATDSSSATQATSGQINAYEINGSSVSTMGSCDVDTGCMRVAVLNNGSQWAVSMHDGSCGLVLANKAATLEWRCRPNISNLELAYAVAITRTEQGDVFVACGANQKNSDAGGLLYLVQSVRMVYDKDNNSNYPPTYFKGVIQWSHDTEFGVNPGVSMDKNGHYVTATDGKPKGKTVKESKGNFYLFNVQNGHQLWQHQTDMMNWPMQLAQNGQSVIGGSDNGSVYYWKLDPG
ncbi:MAG: hypothetical protein OQK49_04600 [Proteobacteria bacterium]|nr:hypothetical protein [Pseudomonadota bacterium]